MNEVFSVEIIYYNETRHLMIIMSYFIIVHIIKKIDIVVLSLCTLSRRPGETLKRT